jgi:hypothetical protein
MPPSTRAPPGIRPDGDRRSPPRLPVLGEVVSDRACGVCAECVGDRRLAVEFGGEELTSDLQANRPLGGYGERAAQPWVIQTHGCRGRDEAAAMVEVEESTSSVCHPPERTKGDVAGRAHHHQTSEPAGCPVEADNVSITPCAVLDDQVAALDADADAVSRRDVHLLRLPWVVRGGLGWGHI